MPRNHLREKVSHDIAIDLGTANTLMSVGSKGILIDEPSLVAVKPDGEVVGIGKVAEMMDGRTGSEISIKRPLVDGVIANFEATEAMLKQYVHTIHTQHRVLVSRPRMIIGLPPSITDVEYRAVRQAARATNARFIYTVEEPVAAAIGAGVQIWKNKVCLVVDVGGGTTDIAVVSFGGAVTTTSLRIAGDELSEVIRQSLRDSQALLVGKPTARSIKHSVASVHASINPPVFVAKGKDALSGLPKTAKISASQLRDQLIKQLRPIVDAVRVILEGTSADLMRSIAQEGIILTGGGAQLKGFDLLLAEELKLPIRVPPNPLTNVVDGAAAMLANPRLFSGLISREDGRAL